MDVKDLIAALPPEIYQRLVQAVELGKWPDGVALTPEQKENSLQAVMLWQSMNNVDPQHMSIGTDGQIVMKSKQELKQQFVAEPLVKLKPQ
ncbi:TPA: YeaC family protein [Serratia marcescens]